MNQGHEKYKLGNIGYKFTVGKKYHIKNGYAELIDELWLNNAEFIGYVDDNNIQLLSFNNNNVIVNIDADLMYKYHHSNKTKCYQFIEVKE